MVGLRRLQLFATLIFTLLVGICLGWGASLLPYFSTDNRPPLESVAAPVLQSPPHAELTHRTLPEKLDIASVEEFVRTSAVMARFPKFVSDHAQILWEDYGASRSRELVIRSQNLGAYRSFFWCLELLKENCLLHINGVYLTRSLDLEAGSFVFYQPLAHPKPLVQYRKYSISVPAISEPNDNLMIVASISGDSCEIPEFPRDVKYLSATLCDGDLQ